MKAYWVAAALLALSLLFWWRPELDHWVSSAFYNSATQHFWLSDHPYLESLRHLVIKVLFLMNAGFLLVLILKIFKSKWVARIKAKTAVYILVCFIVAPGLVVNAILKDHWGRPRPHQVQDYGGSAIFQPVWKMSAQCDRNCSFVCGDCSMVFSLFAFIPLVRRKALLVAAVSSAGLMMSFLRVSAGGHFVSDALMSGLIVYLVISAIYSYLYRARFFSEARVESFFSQLNKRVVRLCS